MKAVSIGFPDKTHGKFAVQPGVTTYADLFQKASKKHNLSLESHEFFTNGNPVTDLAQVIELRNISDRLEVRSRAGGRASTLAASKSASASRSTSDGCSFCGLELDGGEARELAGRFFHSTCFKCSMCFEGLKTGEKVFTTEPGKVKLFWMRIFFFNQCSHFFARSAGVRRLFPKFARAEILCSMRRVCPRLLCSSVGVERRRACGVHVVLSVSRSSGSERLCREGRRAAVLESSLVARREGDQFSPAQESGQLESWAGGAGASEELAGPALEARRRSQSVEFHGRLVASVLCLFVFKECRCGDRRRGADTYCARV